MSHFAEINSDNIVQRVLVIDQETLNTGAWGSPNNWIQTSYNTRGGVHYAPNSNTPDDGVPLRKNYAGVGYTYDETRDAFIAPKPYPSWTLVEESCQWQAPVAYPDDGKRYSWDEDITNWKEVE
jgi:hypothetical protein|tara:strand:- start:5486 stop:5857 length:372 start_codon:yes stop_codon:yes gene_type:complete